MVGVDDSSRTLAQANNLELGRGELGTSMKQFVELGTPKTVIMDIMLLRTISNGDAYLGVAAYFRYYLTVFLNLFVYEALEFLFKQ